MLDGDLPNKTREDNKMKKLMTAGLSLSAVLTALGEVKAYVNYPWCIIGDTRGIDCVFSTREQCTADGRNRGFGSQCIKNPSYDPKRGPVVGSGVMLNSLGGLFTTLLKVRSLGELSAKNQIRGSKNISANREDEVCATGRFFQHHTGRDRVRRTGRQSHAQSQRSFKRRCS
jgi:Protein of unknown function (DUF3551)